MAVVVVVRSKKSKCMNHPMAHKTGTVAITFNHEILKRVHARTLIREWPHLFEYQNNFPQAQCKP